MNRLVRKRMSGASSGFIDGQPLWGGVGEKNGRNEKGKIIRVG